MPGSTSPSPEANGRSCPATTAAPIHHFPFAIHGLTPQAEKSAIRKQVLAARGALDPAARAAHSARITARLLALPGYRSAACVLAYVGFGTECDTRAFIADVFASGKSLVLPRVERAARALRLHRVHDLDAQLAPGVWGIREPVPALCPEVEAADIDFVLVPGVAFTAGCDRLGYGAGYYDRLIAGLAARPLLAAAAFAVQIVPEVPVTEADRPVDIVLTENAEYRRRA